jgi:SnoaL-like domain
MANFSNEQTMAVLSVQQLLADWAWDLDMHQCANVGKLVTEDVVYNVAGAARVGRKAVEDFYRHEFAKFGTGPFPVMRHVISNFRTQFHDARRVSVTFHLIYWTTAATTPTPADIVAVADVHMDCTRASDDDWKISRFDSAQPLRRNG